ncbi:class I SAM-dependent methyltransferase [Haloarchaeobius sp. DFWS5]|uniref:class I SAM-dependent methyltransferase n=1 Tax=Haloarchaeobius sp. DFWS5 TaxID=3446114 RepID=UPI003EBD94AE
MDELTRTNTVYESDSASYVEKYQSMSVAETFGDPFFDALSGERVLDVGCGPGPDSAVFAERGYDVVGFDLTASFLDAARDAVPAGRFARGDMRRLPFAADAFDGVWACASFLHVPRDDAAATLDEFRRVLVPEGVAHVSVKCGDGGSYDEKGRYFEHYQPDEIRRLFEETGFEVSAIETTDLWINVFGRNRD